MNQDFFYKYIDKHSYLYLNEVILEIVDSHLPKFKAVDTSLLVEHLPEAYSQGFMDCLEVIYFLQDFANISLDEFFKK